MNNEHLVQFATALSGVDSDYSMSINFTIGDTAYEVTHNGDLFYPWNVFIKVPGGVEPIGSACRTADDLMGEIVGLKQGAE